MTTTQTIIAALTVGLPLAWLGVLLYRVLGRVTVINTGLQRIINDGTADYSNVKFPAAKDRKKGKSRPAKDYKKAAILASGVYTRHASSRPKTGIPDVEPYAYGQAVDAVHHELELADIELAKAIVAFVIHCDNPHGVKDTHRLLASLDATIATLSEHNVGPLLYIPTPPTLGIPALYINRVKLHELFSYWLGIAHTEDIRECIGMDGKDVLLVDVEDACLKYALYAYVKYGTLPEDGDPCYILRELRDWLNCCSEWSTDNSDRLIQPSLADTAIIDIMRRAQDRFRRDLPSGDLRPYINQLARHFFKDTMNHTQWELILFINIALYGESAPCLGEYPKIVVDDAMRVYERWIAYSNRSN